MLRFLNVFTNLVPSEKLIYLHTWFAFWAQHVNWDDKDSTTMSDSDEQVDHDFTNMPTFEAVYKDGQMEIVQVAQSYEMKSELHQEHSPQVISYSSDNSEADDNLVKVDPETLNTQLDMLNFTLIRYDEDGEGTYRLVANSEPTGDEQDDSEDTVTCVLHTDHEQAAVISEGSDTYVMIQSSDGETMYLQTSEIKQAVDSAVTPNNVLEKVDKPNEDASDKTAKKKPTPEELLMKHKAVQRVRELVSAPVSYNRRGRKRKTDLPPPHELLQSPTLKLYLYNCKQCQFKCNAVRDLHAHRRQAHVGTFKPKTRTLSSATSIQDTLSCTVCLFKTNQASLLKKHIQDIHQTKLDDDVMIVVNNTQANEQQATYLNLLDTPASSNENIF